MFTIPAPDNRDRIGRALAESLGLDVTAVTLVDAELHVDAPDARAGEARAFVAAYTPPPRPPDTDAEFRAALTAATTVTQLRDALLGKAGPGAQARRPDRR